MSAKDTINVKFIDKIKCFCKEDIGEHSLKNLKRHYYKALTALAGSEKYIKELYAELNRINFDLAVYKKKFGEIAIEEIDEIKKGLIAEQEELVKKSQENEVLAKELLNKKEEVNAE